MTLISNRSLQKRFTRSKAFRRAVRIYCSDNGLTGSYSLFYEVIGELVETLSDDQIRNLCGYLLGCEDLKPAEKRQLLHFLCIV